MSEVVNGKPERPAYRNIGLSNVIFRYRMPAPAIVSIMHRVSGVLLLAALPFLLYLFESSLLSEISFEKFRSAVAHPLAKLFILLLIWAYLHHFCAGIRHLVMDLGLGLDKGPSKTSALVVLVVSIVLTLLVAAKFLGVF